MKKLILSLALCLLVFNPLTILANEMQEATENSNVVCSLTVAKPDETDYIVTVPKSLVIDSETLQVDYTVDVEGTFSDPHSVNVIPDSQFTLTKGSKSITGSINQDRLIWLCDEADGTYSTTGTVKLDELPSGTWTGSFSFSICMEDNMVDVQAKDVNGSDIELDVSHLVGSREDKILNGLVISEIISETDEIDALVKVEADDYSKLGKVIFDVSDIAEPGDKVGVLGYNDDTEEWYYICVVTVDADSKITVEVFTGYEVVQFVKIEIPLPEEKPEGSGAYDINGNLLASWSELESLGIKVAENSTLSNSKGYNFRNVIDANPALEDTAIIVIPDSVTTIANYIFNDCNNVKCIYVPKTTTSISKYAFANAQGLVKLVVDENNPVYDSRDNSNSIIETDTNTMIKGCKTTVIPETVTALGECAFYMVCNMNSVNIPASVKSISNNSFNQCEDLAYITVDENNTVYDSRNNCNAIIEKSSNSLVAGAANTVIPDGVESIGEWAFSYRKGLTSITIPNTVTSLGMGAFYKSGLTSIVIPESITAFENSYEFSYCADLKSVTFSDSLTKIGIYSFEGCVALEELHIPKSVSSISSSSFQGCSGLTKITVSEENTTFDSRDNCNAIIKKTGNSLVRGCKNTVIPDSVKRIGDSAFYGCTGLTSIAIPNTVDSIGYSVFRGCTNLEEIEIPSKVTKLNTYTFSQCSNLKSVILPNGLTTIKDNNFEYCTSLEEITIPNTVTTFGEKVFKDCSALVTIFYNGSATGRPWGAPNATIQSY